jgi:NADH-quinone oxidoreductase subunit J
MGGAALSGAAVSTAIRAIVAVRSARAAHRGEAVEALTAPHYPHAPSGPRVAADAGGQRQGPRLINQVINPAILYLLLALAGLGVFFALPRRGINPQALGALLAAIGGGLVVLVMSVKADGYIPNLFFYLFSAIALGGALRVITHPRPVYAALYFILTILSSAGLFVLLGAEFLAFALVIVYAGAILITYLFVIMLATQAPIEDQTEVLAEYDVASREPAAATFVGFLLLAVLTTLMFRGVGELPLPARSGSDAALAREVPGLASGSNISGVAVSLLRDHPGAIEIAGIVLLMAMLGAVVLARKQVQLDEEAKARHAARLADESGGGA